MTDSSTATSSRHHVLEHPAAPGRAARHRPPGAVITLALVTDQAAPRRRGRAPAATAASCCRAPATTSSPSSPRCPTSARLPTGEPVAIVRVEARARIGAVHTSERGATYADAEILRDPRPTPRVEALARELRVVLEQIAELRRSRRLPELLRSGLEPGALADGVAAWADLDEERRRDVLAAVDVGERVELVLAWARDHLAELQVAETIRNDVSEGVDKQQREYLLRQQLAAIRKELGEGDDDVVGEYRTKLETLEARRRACATSWPRRSTGWSAPAPSRPSRAGSAPGWTGSSSCRGAPAATTASTSSPPRRSSTPTTTAWPT